MNDDQNTFHIFQLNSISIKFFTTESHNLLIIIKRFITNFIKKENVLNVWSKTTHNLRREKYCEGVRICLLDHTILVYHTLTIAIFNHSLPISTDMTEIDSAKKKWHYNWREKWMQIYNSYKRTLKHQKPITKLLIFVDEWEPRVVFLCKRLQQQRHQYRLSSRENNYKPTSIVYGYLHVSFCKYIYNKVNTAS